MADDCDLCEGSDDTRDSDGDGVPDGCDECEGFNDLIDTNDNGVPDGCEDGGPGDTGIGGGEGSGELLVKGCDCDSSSGATGWWLLGLLGLLVRRRERAVA